MIFKTLDDCKRVAFAGKPKEVIDKFVESYLQSCALNCMWEESGSCDCFDEWVVKESKKPGFSMPDVDVDAFYCQNYKALRYAKYPPIEDYLDGLIKTYSTDQSTVAEGEAQRQQYANDCLAVKEQIPKE